LRKFGNYQFAQRSTLGETKLQRQCSVLVVLLAVLVATITSADVSFADTFQRSEYSVFGQSNSSSWRSFLKGQAPVFDKIGGLRSAVPDEFGVKSSSDEKDKSSDSGRTSNMGRKVKTGFLSAIMPGAGQYYNGHKKKAFIMAGVEVGIWTAYFVFDKQGDNRMASAREYAGLYAGTSGSHEEAYWQNVGKYMDSDAYNESRLREARAFQEPISGLATGLDAWQWDNEDRKSDYQMLRADGNNAYNRRDFMILFSVINRAFSVVDGVMGVKSHPGGIEADVLGMNVSLDMVPDWQDPGAKWAISRSF